MNKNKKFYGMKLQDIECGWKDQLNNILEEDGKKYSPKKVHDNMVEDYTKISDKIKEIIKRGIKTNDLMVLLHLDILLYTLYLNWTDSECELDYNGIGIEDITPDLYELYLDQEYDSKLGIQEYKLFN